MVIFAHASFTNPPSLEKWLIPFDYFGNGEYGVTIFFVLSGYLITSILLREYDTIGHLDMKAFYMRRILRIFPAFYTFFFFVLGLDLFGVLHLHAREFVLGAHISSTTAKPSNSS